MEVHDSCRADIAELRGLLTKALEKIDFLQKENLLLREEIARLKGHKGRPNIGPSRLLQPEPKKPGVKREIIESREVRKPTKTIVVPLLDKPAGCVHKGYADFAVQELSIQSEKILYRLEKWQTPEGKILKAKLPLNTGGQHFGPQLQAHILYQYHQMQTTEPLLLESLFEYDVQISAGELHALLTSGQDAFHAEKKQLLKTGLEVSGYIQVDDTGARHAGQNGFCQAISNEFFAFFESTNSKSQGQFLNVLQGDSPTYVLNEQATAKLPTLLRSKIHSAFGTFQTRDALEASLKTCGILKVKQQQQVIQAVQLASLETKYPTLCIVSDDAGQFNILLHQLCWIHQERLIAKLIGFNDADAMAIEATRCAIWTLYDNLKRYKKAPTQLAKNFISTAFDSLCSVVTSCATLNLALQRMLKNKAELLLVLERPELPLHNNLSEGDVREYVKRRKVSGGTRSAAGRAARDTFASLKKTCRKLGVSFWAYIIDRICGARLVPHLCTLLEARSLRA